MDSKFNHSLVNDDEEIDYQSNDNISLKNYDNSNTFTTYDDSKYDNDFSLKNKIQDQSYDNDTFLKSKEDNQYCILPNNTRSNGFYEDDSDSNNSKKDESEESSNSNLETDNTELNNSATNLSTSVNKLNTINYEKYFERQLKNVKSSYSSKELEESEDSNLLNIFYSFDLIIFTDDYKLLNKNLINFFCFWNKNCISESNFPGIAFLSFDSINYLKYKLSDHNKKLQDSEIEKQQNDNIHNFQICFDEGDFYKNMVYKKLQIQDKFLFVPYSKYQLKLTEYKLRSFCQIMEELGAVEIEIDFDHISLDKKSKKVELQTEEFNYIASSLGFSASKSEDSKNDITYKLKYPFGNTLILNEKAIISRIERGKFLINKKTFDSNLELQFIIKSRCRHFIENYSTVFTLDNSINYDKKMISKLKSNNFNCGFEYESKSMKKMKISINTRVKFCDQDKLGTNLLGNNVGFDSSGFNYLMGSMNFETFSNIGIYKIISFIGKYLKKIEKKKNYNDYTKIKKLFKNINKEFSFQEYKDLLLEYFDIDSQWINFLNFINVLKFESVFYNKLGFLILMSQNDLKYYSKNLKIIDFIRHFCEKNKLEEEFWEMLEPTNYFLIIKKLDNDYNLIRKYNWFNFQKLIRDLKKYNPNLKETFNKSEIDCQNYYSNLYTNFILGHHNNQFEKYIKPFLYKFICNNFKERIDNINEKCKDDTFFSNFIFQAIKTKHFINHELNTLDKLKNLIENKFTQIEEAIQFYNDLFDKIDEYRGYREESNLNSMSTTRSTIRRNNNINNDNLVEVFYKVLKVDFDPDTFKKNYPFLFKKFSYIIDECDIKNYEEESLEKLENEQSKKESKESIENDNSNVYLNPKEKYLKSLDDKEKLSLMESELKDLIFISMRNTSKIEKITLNIVKKLLIYDFNITENKFINRNLTNKYFTYINDYVRNFDQNKCSFIKIKFFIELANFMINQNYCSNNKKYKDRFFNSDIYVQFKNNPYLNYYDLNQQGNESKCLDDQSIETLNLIKQIKNCYTYKNLLELIYSFLKDLGINIKDEVYLLFS